MLIFLLFISFADKSFSNEEKNHILECFKALNIRESELHYEKKWATDTIFRLKCVEKLLDNPLYVPDYVDSFTQIVKNLPKTLHYIAKEAEMNPGDIVALKKEIETQLQYEGRVPTIFAPLVVAFKVANKYLKQAIKNLTTEEMDKILMYAPVLWGNEEDSLDLSLKGSLHREFNVIIDTTMKISADTILELSKKVDRESLSRACFAVIIGVELTTAVIKNIDFQSMNPITIDNVEGNVLLHISTEFGDFVVGGISDNTYHSDFAVIIEPGGDDIYKSRAGGGIGVISHPFSVVIDIKGNDIYSSYKLFNFGTGIFGTGILLDAEGDDTYRSSHYSLGAGLFGAGMLIDSCGNDIYEGGYFTQGAGNFGLGALIDYKGNDTYKAHSYAQGMGGTFGVGLLIELEGADLYYSGGRYLDAPLWPKDYSSMAQGFATGVRPDASGGIGFLYDKSGNDFYNGGVYSQGTGYWYSLGMLVDEQGNDYYTAVEYAQGTGIHLAVGTLIDKEGDDLYFSRVGPAQGEGHDLSVGFLIDKEGNDTYSVSGGQGIGLANGIGIFIDSNGNDTYTTTEEVLSQGSGKEARGFPSSGIFLDLRGRDKYGRYSSGEDKSRWVQGSYGAGIDLSAERVIEEEKPEEEIEEELEGKPIDELFKIACLWEVGSATKKARKARKMLIEKGDEALNYIFPEKLDTKTTLVLRAIRDISDSLQSQASPRLIKCLKDEKPRVKANAIWVLGEIKDSNAVDSLLSALNDPKIKPRLVLKALGDIGDKRVVPDIVPYLNVQNEPDRIYACYALQKLKDQRSIIPLISALNDPYFTVRNAAEKALIEIGDSSLVPLLNSLDDAKDIAKPHIIRAIGVIGERLDTLNNSTQLMCAEISQKLLKYLEHEDSIIRGFTVEAIGKLREKCSNEVYSRLKQHIKDEKDEFVISRYRKFEQ